MVVWLCFCGGVAVFLCWCGCVFVVVWLCFCGGLVVSLRVCFCVFVVVWFCFCGGVFVVVPLWREVLEKRVTRRVLEESVVEECCREVLGKSVGGEAL